MAIAITSSPNLVEKIYSDIIFDIYDSARASNSDLYYQIDIIVGSETRTLKQLPDINKHAAVNISKILQGFMESALYVHSAMFSHNTGGILSYHIVAKSVSGGVESSITDTTKHVINGTEQYGENFNYLLYVPLNISNNRLWLNGWTSTKKIHPNDSIYLQTIIGDLNGVYIGVISGITAKLYYKNGTTLTRTITYTPSSTAGILSINVGPTALTAADPLLVFTDVYKYEITESAGRIPSPAVIYINEVDTRYDKYFRIAFIGPAGTTELFNFDLNNQNSINITRSTYEVNSVTKTYNTLAEDSYEVLSDYMTESQSIDLKYLWTSPVVAELVGYTLKPLVMNTNKVDILKRRNGKLLNYTASFKYANRYVTYRQ